MYIYIYNFSSAPFSILPALYWTQLLFFSRWFLNFGVVREWCGGHKRSFFNFACIVLDTAAVFQQVVSELPISPICPFDSSTSKVVYKNLQAFWAMQELLKDCD